MNVRERLRLSFHGFNINSSPPPVLDKSGLFHQASFCGPGGLKVNVLGSCEAVGGPEDEILSLVSSRVSASFRADGERVGWEVLNLKREERVESRLLRAPVPSGAESGSGAI